MFFNIHIIRKTRDLILCVTVKRMKCISLYIQNDSKIQTHLLPLKTSAVPSLSKVC